MKEKLTALIAEVEQFTAQKPEQVEEFRIKILGSKGILKDLFADFKNVANEEKREVGQLINQVKENAQSKIV